MSGQEFFVMPINVDHQGRGPVTDVYQYATVYQIWYTKTNETVHEFPIKERADKVCSLLNYISNSIKMDVLTWVQSQMEHETDLNELKLIIERASEVIRDRISASKISRQ